MTYELLVREEIEDEVVDIATWYEQQKEGEGKRFLVSFEKSLLHIQEMPLLYKPSEYGPPKARMYRYPYYIFFTIEAKVITIRAVVHMKRNPDWIRTRFQ